VQKTGFTILLRSVPQVVRFWLQHLAKLVGGYPAAALARGRWAALTRAAAGMLTRLPASARCAGASRAMNRRARAGREAASGLGCSEAARHDAAAKAALRISSRGI